MAERHRRSSARCEGSTGAGEGVRDGSGEPYGAFRYRGVSIIGGKWGSVFSRPRAVDSILGEDGFLSN
jgi:hypothetical protein